MKPGDRVRIKHDLILVDGAAIDSGLVFTVTRAFNVKTQHGVEPRVRLSREDDESGMILTQVRLDQIERAEE